MVGMMSMKLIQVAPASTYAWSSAGTCCGLPVIQLLREISGVTLARIASISPGVICCGGSFIPFSFSQSDMMIRHIVAEHQATRGLLGAGRHERRHRGEPVRMSS